EPVEGICREILACVTESESHGGHSISPSGKMGDSGRHCERLPYEMANEKPRLFKGKTDDREALVDWIICPIQQCLPYLSKVRSPRVKQRLDSCVQAGTPEVFSRNLTPADLKKDAGGFDLPIALRLLLGSGQVALDRPGSFAIVGELALTREARPTKGPLALALQAAAHPRGPPPLPPPNPPEGPGRAGPHRLP